MKILIIGGTGIISGAITRILQNEHDLMLFNNDQERPQWLNPEVTVITGDRNDYKDFEAKLSGAGTFDCVLDMIAFHPDDAELDVRVFTGKTQQFIFCSTVDVYTKPASHYPITEDAEKSPSLSFSYAFNKARCEEVYLQAHQQKKFNVTIIRPAHTIGPGGVHLVHSLGTETYIVDRIKKQMPIIVHGDGNSVWSVNASRDVAYAFMNAIGNQKAFGKAYHVANDTLMTWKQYYGLIAEALNVTTPPIMQIPVQVLQKLAPQKAFLSVENFQYNNIFDSTLARTELGFRNATPLIELFKTVVEWSYQMGKIDSAADYTFYDDILAKWKAMVDTL